MLEGGKKMGKNDIHGQRLFLFLHCLQVFLTSNLLLFLPLKNVKIILNLFWEAVMPVHKGIQKSKKIGRSSLDISQEGD